MYNCIRWFFKFRIGGYIVFLENKEKIEKLLMMLNYQFKSQESINRKSEVKVKEKTIIYSGTTSPLADSRFLVEFCQNNQIEIINEFIKTFNKFVRELQKEVL